jgi:Tol biopolymer transport system component
MSGASTVNLWVMNADGTNQKPLTNGQNQAEPACPADDKWVYFIDRDDRGYLKRVSIDGGPVETVVGSAMGPFVLSADGKRILSTTVREFDHKMMWRVDDVETRKTEFYEADPKALGSAILSHDGKDVIYPVREHAVDNLWKRRLEGGAPQQLTHFTAEKIEAFAYSPDGRKLGMVRGHFDSDAVLLHDVGK